MVTVATGAFLAFLVYGGIGEIPSDQAGNGVLKNERRVNPPVP